MLVPLINLFIDASKAYAIVSDSGVVVPGKTSPTLA